jgi:hypothetical protein
LILGGFGLRLNSIEQDRFADTAQPNEQAAPVMTP